MSKLFIGGFPPDTDEMKLAQLLSDYGRVVTIQIIRDKITRKSKGYAFIEMEDKADADAVIDNLDGTMMGDRELTIHFATAKNEGPAFTRFNKPAARDNTRVKRPRRPS